MSEHSNNERKPIHSMHVDHYHEFIEQAESVSPLPTRPVVRPAVTAPVLTLEVDEMTAFTDKAIDSEQTSPPKQTGTSEKRESA